MNLTYVYMHHDASVFFLTERALTSDELYCPYCNASDSLIGCYDNENLMAKQLLSLFESGYDLIPCDDYLDIKDRYCPPKYRLWELEQFTEDSAEYAAYAQRLKTAESTYWKK